MTTLHRTRHTAMLGLLLVAAPAGAQAPAADYGAYPCLSYTLACGEIATRKPVTRTLDGPLGGNAEQGRQIAQSRDKGNCLACHIMQGGSQPGTRGPDLSRYGSSGRSDGETYTAIYDMRTRNAETLMPPFGTNEVLSDADIRHVVAFLQASK